MKKYPLTIIIVLLLALMSVNDVVQAGNIPTISIVGVTEDLKVTIQTHNYPANREFDVRMGKFSTRGIGGILVGTFNSGTGGSQKFTFDIPPALYEEQAIAIRTDSKTGGYYSYNWFTNKTFGSHTGGTPVEGGKDTPAILVVTVKKDTFVTIEGFGFPDENFDVLMGKFNTQGIDGIKVDTLTPDDDGEIKESFDIPESLKSENRKQFEWNRPKVIRLPILGSSMRPVLQAVPSHRVTQHIKAFQQFRSNRLKRMKQ